MIQNNKRHTDKKCRGEPAIVPSGSPEYLYGPDLAGKATGEHGIVHLLAQPVGLAEQVSHPRGDPALLRAGRQIADRPADARLMQLGHGPDQERDVAIGHRQDQDEQLRHPERGEGPEEFVPAGGQGEEERQRERSRHSAGKQSSPQKPLAGHRKFGRNMVGADLPPVSQPGHYPERLPRSNDVEQGRQGDQRAEQEDEGNDPAEEQPGGDPRKMGEHEGREPYPPDGRGSAEEAYGNDQGEDGGKFAAGIDPLQEAFASGVAVAQKRLRGKGSGGIDGLFQVARRPGPGGAGYDGGIPLLQPAGNHFSSRTVRSLPQALAQKKRRAIPRAADRR